MRLHKILFQGDPALTWNYYTGFDDACTGKCKIFDFLVINILEMHVGEIVQDSLKVALSYQLTNPEQERHSLHDEL